MHEILQILTPERSRIRRALGVLGLRYPNGLDWLERRLDDIESGRAQLWQAGLGKFASGWAIVTPKGLHEAKLSTIFVSPAARGKGLGSGLIHAVSADLRQREIFNARVTVDETDWATRTFFERIGYEALPDSRRQYGTRFDCGYSLNLDAPSLLPVAAH